MGEDPEAPNYDPKLKLIRSMQNGSRGPMLRKATALDWVGDSFDVRDSLPDTARASTPQFLAHYEEYTDVDGDHFLNLVATTLPTNAYLMANEPQVQTVAGRLHGRRGSIGCGATAASFPALSISSGKIGGPENKWWGNAYGWGFSPVNPVTGARENRNRIPRALLGFSNALLVTGDQKYVDAWRTMIDAVNAHARTTKGRKQYPTMHGADGWYGWQNEPWNVGALELWYWSQKSTTCHA